MMRRWIAALLLSITGGIFGLIFLYNYRVTNDGKVIEAVNSKLALGAVRLRNKLFLVTITGDSSLPGDSMVNSSRFKRISRVKLIPVGDEFKCNEDCAKIAALLESMSLHYSLDSGDGLGSHVLKDDSQAYFTANKHMLDEFEKLHVDQTMGYAAVGAVMGYVGIECLPDMSYCLSLQSKTSTQRYSTRFKSRGADECGNVSNFIESEFRVYRKRAILGSFLQIRGSIPFNWSQTPDMTAVTPPIIIGESNEESFTKHMALLQKLYPTMRDSILLLSLVDMEKERRESQIGKYYESLAENCKQNFLSFDYHCESAKPGWEINLSKKIEEKVKITFTSHDTLQQSTLIRTNCIDCLDRTNAVQTVLALIALKRILGSDDDVKLYEKLVPLARKLWTMNGNIISRHYAGTDALKSDVAMHGTRTFSGIIYDYLTSSRRFIQARTSDEEKARLMGIIHGDNCVPGNGEF